MVTKTALLQKLGGDSAIATLVDSFYQQIMSDYRLNRIFNEDSPEQRKALTEVVIAGLNGGHCHEDSFKTKLDDFFHYAFSRSKRDSLVSGSDFNFLGMIIEQDIPNPNPLCKSHNALLKFCPDDTEYNIFLENLEKTLTELQLESNLKANIMELAESLRDLVLGK